jgi:predicted PurR-regulated permease PerM
LTGWRLALWAVVAAIALVFLWSVRSVLVPFAVAWIVAVLLEPLVARLEGVLAKPFPKAKRTVSIATINLVFFTLVIAAGLWVGPRMVSQFGELQKSVQDLTETISEESRTENHFVRWNPVVRAQPPGPLGAVDRALEQLAPTLDRVGLPSTRRAIFDQYLAPQRDQIAEGIAAFFNGFFRILVGAASQLFLFIFVPLFVFFFLADMDSYGARVMSWIPPALRPGINTVASDVGKVFKSYLRGVLVNVSIYTTFFALLFSLLGLPFSILLGVLAGILYLIPVLGGAIMSVSLALVIGFSGASGTWLFSAPNSWLFGIIMAVVFVVVSTIYDMVLTPRLVGSAVGLDPLVSMFVVFSGGALFGLPGMILAYPLAGAVKVTMSRVLGVTNQTSVAEKMALPSVPVRHRELSESLDNRG